MSGRWWKWAWRLGVTLALLVILGVLGFFSLPWLVIGPSETAKADVMLYLGIDERFDTDTYVAELYRQGVVRDIVCLSGQVAWQVYPADYARAHLIELGVPAEHLFTMYLPQAECRAQVMPLVARFVKEHGWQSALMVIDPSVSRANRRVGVPAFSREQLTLAINYSPRDYQLLTTRWWQEHWKIQRLASEALEVSFDLLYANCR